jgi:hypothetical protein
MQEDVLTASQIINIKIVEKSIGYYKLNGNYKILEENYSNIFFYIHIKKYFQQRFEFLTSSLKVCILTYRLNLLCLSIQFID